MKSIFLPGLALLLSLTSTTLAQENQELGRMWTFENPPLAYLDKEYGFEPDQEWLDSLRLGSLRLGGEDILSSFGSASFVSPNGLILTSNRSLRIAIAATMHAAGSSEAGDPAKTLTSGFVAESLEQEIRLRSTTKFGEWLTAAQLLRMRNVTDEVNRGVESTDTTSEKKTKRDANKRRILDEARAVEPKLVAQIVGLYQGAVFQLYQYKVYDDVRLVCTPHAEVARFGGVDEDSSVPRYGIDFAILRAYEDGKPANTSEHWLRWKPGGAQKGELVFVSGNPSITKRLFTKAQLKFERDLRMPIRVEWLTNRFRYWRDQRMLVSPQFAAFTPLLEEGLKVASGNLLRLQDAKLMTQKDVAEQLFKGRVLADEKLAERYGDLWDRIESVVEKRRRYEARAQFYSTVGIGMLDMAITVVRSCDPAETEEYRRQAQEEIASWASTGRSALPTVAIFADHVTRARGWLSKDDPYLSKVLGGMSGEEFLQGPAGRSLVYSREQRNALVKAGWNAIQECEDVAIAAAREYVILMRENEELNADLVAQEEALYAEMGRALLACYGMEVSADATGTARFTDGVVAGFRRNGLTEPHHTTFSGLYARNTASRNATPFQLPKIWLDRRATIDMSKSVNFVTTNDITSNHLVCRRNFWRDPGGSSGSVVVNKDLEVVGLVIERAPLSNDFLFREEQSHTISVHVDGIMEALVKIYDARRIAKELTGK